MTRALAWIAIAVIVLTVLALASLSYIDAWFDLFPIGPEAY
jgi:hypothetical protein